MSGKLRVYEVARDLGMENKALVSMLQSLGVPDVRNHMSAVAPEVIERIKRHMEKAKAPAVVEERIRPTVVKRRAVSSRGGGEASSPSHAPPSAPGAPPSAPAASVAPESRARAPESVPLRAPAEPPSVRPHVPAASAPPPPSSPVSAPPISAAPVSAPAASAPVPPVASVPVPPVTAPRIQELAEPPPPASEPRPAPVVAPAALAAEPAPPPVVVAPPPAPEPPRPPTPKTGIDVWEGRPGVPVTPPQRGTPLPRRVQYDPKAGAGAPRARSTGALPQMQGRGGPGGRGGMRPRGIGSMPKGKISGQVVTQERSAHKKIVRIEESIGLQGLAAKIGVKATEVLMKLMRLGMTGVNINSTLDADTAKIVANEFGWEVEDIAVSEADQLVLAQGGESEEGQGLAPRPPVVTVMGHVDHGKTSLLDQIRKSNVAAGEAGGITQHVGAYSVDTPLGPVTFLDTPGHEAFTAMRARGAQTTDIVVLVVAADDGVMPQTREAINHARSAEVPIVVAINKIDKPEAEPERVKRQLSELGLVPEDWGGETQYQEVSALTRKGIDELLEKIVLQADVLELRATPSKPGTGVVVEAELDRGRGPVATVLVTDGTLNHGDVILAGGAYGKVRAMHDSLGRQLRSAGPSTPVVIIGLNDVPSAGDPMHVVKDMKKAQEIADTRKIKERKSLVPSTGVRAMSLEDLAKAMQETDQLELKLIIKADVQGSVEAVAESLVRLSTDKVRVSVVHSGAGAVTEGDVNLAVAAGAIIIGFNVRPAGKAAALALKESVQIRQYNIIYNVVDEVKAAMEGLLQPTQVEKNIGRAEVRQTFKLSKAGAVAGCMVVEGVIRRSAGVRLLRDSAVIWTGKIASLKRFKDDVREVKEGFDCGIAFEGYNDAKEGDVVEAFEMEEVKQTL